MIKQDAVPQLTWNDSLDELDSIATDLFEDNLAAAVGGDAIAQDLMHQANLSKKLVHVLRHSHPTPGDRQILDSYRVKVRALKHARKH